MKPISFPEQNITFAADQTEYQPLPAFLGSTFEGQAITCWGLTWRERIRLLFTGRLWLQMLTFHRPLTPVFLTTEKADIFQALGNENGEDLEDFTELDTYVKSMAPNPRFSSIITSFWAENGTRYLQAIQNVGPFYLEFHSEKRAFFDPCEDNLNGGLIKYRFAHFKSAPFE
jgi:hypothetical protein